MQKLVSANHTTRFGLAAVITKAYMFRYYFPLWWDHGYLTTVSQRNWNPQNRVSEQVLTVYSIRNSTVGTMSRPRAG